LNGGEISPVLASRIMLYTYCNTFKINPIEAYQTPISIIKNMLTIHQEVEELKAKEIQKQMK
jgi:hypothetical protein